jgi:ATP-dependent DNA helicase PIF1
VVGDFLQLPPVDSYKFCFQSNIWKSLGLNKENSVFISKVQRQIGDNGFIDILNSIRVGKITDEMIDTLNKCLITNKSIPNDGIIPTSLYCTNKDVNKANSTRLAKIDSPTVCLTSLDNWEIKPSTITNQKHCIDQMNKYIPEEIELKKDAQVMLLRNKINGG